MELEVIGEVAFRLRNMSPIAMADDELLEYYRTINAIEQASWVTRCAVSAEIYQRIRSRVSVRPGARKADDNLETLQGQISKVCAALGVGYQTFLYDVRIYNAFFNADLDGVATIPASRMIEASFLFNRSIFAEAVVSDAPRETIDEMVAQSMLGEVVTSLMVRHYIKQKEGTTGCKAKGKVLAVVREGALPVDIERHIVAVLEATARVLEGQPSIEIDGFNIRSTPEGIKIDVQ